MELVSKENIAARFKDGMTYTAEEIKKIIGDTPFDMDRDKVISRIYNMSTLVNQSHIFDIVEIVEDGGKTDSIFD